MKRNLVKLAAFLVGVSMVSANVIPAYAADTQNTVTTTNVQTNGKTILTLDEAIESAISSSATLELYDKKIQFYQNKNNINEKIDDANNADSDTENYHEDVADLELSQVKQQRDYAVDKLKYNVTKAYNAIVTSQLQIQKSQNDIDLEQRKLETSKLKEKLGLATSIQIEGLEASLQSSKNTLKNSQETLTDAKYSFKNLTAKDVDRYILESDIQYEKFTLDDSLDTYLDNIINQYMEYNEELLKVNKDYLDDNKVSMPKESDYEDIKEPTLEAKGEDGKLLANDVENYVKNLIKYNGQKGAYVSMLSARLTYLQSRYSMNESQTNLDEGKKSYKEALRTIYTNMVNIERNIDLIKQNLELQNKQLRLSKTQYDLGLMTKIDYDQKVNDCETLNIQLRTLVDQYNQLKEQIQKPWIALS